jgi:hypothetical protein
MKTTMISAAVNAYAEGFEGASEWIERDAPGGEPASAWRARCRANIVSDYDRGAGCAICSAGIDLADFLLLLAEWDRGFDEVMALGSKGSVKKGESAMTDRDRLTVAFDAMNPWSRGMLLELAEGYAVDFPAPKPAPHLPLVSVGRTDASQEQLLAVSSVEGGAE